MRSTDSSEVLSVLLAEYQRTYSEIMDMQRKSETLFGFGLTGVGAAVIYGLKGEAPAILAVSTVFSLVLFLYIISCYSIILALGGYKRYIEELINSQTGTHWLVWEGSMTKSLLHDRKEMRLLWFCLFCIPVALFFLSIEKVEFSSAFIESIFILVSAGMILACVLSAFNMMRSADKAYAMARFRGNRR